jgi:phage-related protein
MAHNRWEVEFYQTVKGRCPTDKFISSLPKNDVVYILNGFEQLEEHGDRLTRPQAAPLGGGLWELRVRVRKVQYRFFYFFFVNRKCVVTHGIKKKGDTKREVAKARIYMKEFIDRHSRR